MQQFQKFLTMFGTILVAANISAFAATDLKVQKQNDGVLVATPSGTLRLQVWSDKMVRGRSCREMNCR